MPELVEVEVLVSELKKFEQPVFSQLYAASSRFSATDASGLTIINFDRKGKFILMQTNRNLTIVLHLGMSGAVLSGDCRETLTNVRNVFCLNNEILSLVDPRGFGRFNVILTENLASFSTTFTSLGFDILAPDFPVDKASLLMSNYNKTRPIKQVLLEQKVLAGVGNYIADEALHQAQVHPNSIDIGPTKCSSLIAAVRDVCLRSLDKKGLSIRDYKLLDGSLGGFADQLRVYNRKGMRCYTCDRPLESIKIHGRTSTFCINCQKP